MRFVGISGQDDRAEMEIFVDEYGVDGFDHVADVRGQVWSSFNITAQPSYIFLNEDGSIQRQIGALEEEELRDVLDTLLASSP